MQKEMLFKFDHVINDPLNPGMNAHISDYQQKDLAVYDFQLNDADIKQIKKLTKDGLTFQIPQLNINYCNSFNENFNITIQYAPIKIYDLDLLKVDGTGINWTNMQDKDKAHDIQTLKPDNTKHTQSTRKCDNILMDLGQQIIIEVQPKAHTFSLQQQSINSLINELNYPLKHIPYQTEHIIEQGNGIQYLTNLDGEIDVTKQVYWDQYNGKLRFNYKGITLDYTQFQQCFTADSVPGYPDDYIGYFPLPLTYHSDSDSYTSNFFHLDPNVKTTFTYSYCQSYVDTTDPLTMIQTGSTSNIWVKRLDSNECNKVFYITNLYYANQLMGFTQNPQQLFNFIDVFNKAGNFKTIKPQCERNNYFMQLWLQNNDPKYLKNLNADLYFDVLNASDGFTQTALIPDIIENPSYNPGGAFSYYSNPEYIIDPDKNNWKTELSYDRQMILSKEFFLQIWREVYVITPSLQSNTILFKPENLRYYKFMQYCNTNNGNGENFKESNKNDNPFLFIDKLNLIAYYVNSVSFNNYVSLQNNYPLQYIENETFDVEALKNMTFILLDENGVLLPRLSEFKVYLQFQQNQNNAAQSKTTNFNRVLTGDN